MSGERAEEQRAERLRRELNLALSEASRVHQHNGNDDAWHAFTRAMWRANDELEEMEVERLALVERVDAAEKESERLVRNLRREYGLIQAAEERVVVLENLDRYIYELAMSQKTGRIKAVLEEAGLRPTESSPGGRAVYQRLRSENRARIEELVGTLQIAERAILDAQNIICPENRLRWVGSGIVLDKIRAVLRDK